MQKINKKITVLLTIWVILIFIGVGSISYISGKANQKYEDSIYYYKVLNAPTRSIKNISVTEDTAFIRRAEEKYKQLVK